MAYEVVKTIGARQYRYRVQSERDPLTGKSRNRWAYIGRVVSERNVAAVRPPRTNARLRLLEAVERLLAAGDASAVTVAAITGAAGADNLRSFAASSHTRLNKLSSLCDGNWPNTRL